MLFENPFHTGEILSLANYPTFDPNKAGEANLDARLNRAAAAIYEMGSTFKGFTVAAGLDSGVATPMSTFDARQPFQLGYQYLSEVRLDSVNDTLLALRDGLDAVGLLPRAMEDEWGPGQMEFSLSPRAGLAT